MNTALEELITDNRAWADARPRLSVLIPFFGDDPRALVAALVLEGRGLNGAVELVLLDDGSANDALAAEVASSLADLAMPARFVRRLRNEGRARGRNRLVSHARAASVLFLDADMRPDSSRFLANWLDHVESGEPVMFGGFSLAQAPHSPAHAVHRQMALKAECLPASRRSQAPEKYLFTCNLMVRRDVFDAFAFDPDFRGWGWEDVEWAIRVGRAHSIRHIDNPASHLGLDTVAALATKYEQSLANFDRTARLHPEVVRQFPSYRAARLLARAPLRPYWRPLLKRAALSHFPPARLRGLCLRIYRAALYAEVVG